MDESSDSLPMVYDPATISTYWGKRPQAVATRIVQLLSVAGGFLSSLILDIINKRVKEVKSISVNSIEMFLIIICILDYDESVVIAISIV